MGIVVSRSSILANARHALVNLEKTGDSGFEGFIQRLLSAHLGVSLRLSSSGEQDGRDMSAGTVAAEAKRYGQKKLNLRELAGEAVLAKAASHELEFWILATTDTLAQQKVARLEKVAAQAKLEIGIVDWAPADCPRLLALVHQHESVALHWFEENAPAAWKDISVALAEVRSQAKTLERVGREIQDLGRGLALTDALRRTLVHAVNSALSDESGDSSKALFGQRIDFYAPSAGAISRPELNTRLDRSLANAEDNGNHVLAIVGPEGVGKTWAIVRYVVERWPDRPMLFISSNMFQLAATGDWGHTKLLVESVLRSIALVKDCDPRLRDERYVAKLLTALRQARSDKFSPIVILDGFNERDGAHWGSAISGLRNLLSLSSDPPILVTTRASPWPQLARILQKQAVGYSDFDVFGFSETEFKAACTRQGVDASAFDAETAKDLRNPRLFRIAAGLLNALAGAPVTRERIFWEYWRHRQEEDAGKQIETDEFASLLKAHVRDAWSNLRLLKGERTLYIDVKASQEAARFAGVEHAVHDLQDVLSSDFFSPGDRDDSREWRIASNRLNYVLGLSLQRRLVEVTDRAMSLEDNRQAVEIQLGEDIDPMADTDSAGVIVATALLASCLQSNRNPSVSVACLVYLLHLRNARNHDVAPTVRGMVYVAACADPAIFVEAVEEMEDRDPWLVEALRTAHGAGTDQACIVDAVRSWLGDESPNELVTTAIHILAGHNLAPFGKLLRERQDPDGYADLSFWLMFLDEASRSPVSPLDIDGDAEFLDNSEELDNEHDDPLSIETLLKQDLDREIASSGDGGLHREDDIDEAGDYPWTDAEERGHVPAMPPSLGEDWLGLDEHLPRLLERRWNPQVQEVHLFHVELLENRLVALPLEKRVGFLRTVFLRSPPPSSPTNYELRYGFALPESAIDELLANTLGDEKQLGNTLGWLNYFGLSKFDLSEQTARALVAVLVDNDRVPELRADVAQFLGRSKSFAVAQWLEQSGWLPELETNTVVSMHAATALLPFCSVEGGYHRLRDRIVATILCDAIDTVPSNDLPAVLHDFDTHVGQCRDDIPQNWYPTGRTASGNYLDPKGSDRRLALATLEMSITAAHRIARADPALAIKWFSDLMDVRTAFWGDESLIEFLSGLIVGIGVCDIAAAATGLDRLIAHLADVNADADDAVLLPERLVEAAFMLPCDAALAGVMTNMVLLANDDATLCLIARSAKGAWRDWLEKLCENERSSERPARVARARTLQAMARLKSASLPEEFGFARIERFATAIEDERRIAEASIKAWVSAVPNERKELEETFFDAASGQLLDLPDLGAVGEIGQLFAARIELHERNQIESRTGQLFGMNGAPTRFVAANSSYRVFPVRSNRKRRFAESAEVE
ncbi:hypothetical protein [Rhizobium herbae]|uniref:ATP-binding protein n=1 Tax=Rhizobium herbae TaxID=508661 RepID=A0ABS4EUD2_9HYPH|nr:hypothetical protein [Rhizobium herbae]MBP1861565.1 hypothetical protein [Rhizobium herbae]